jgi:vancomycin resistance protein VanJ
MAFQAIAYQPYTRRTGPRVGLLALTLPYPLAVLALYMVHLFHPTRNGTLALTQVFAPLLFLPLLVLVPFALARGMGLLRVILALCAVVYGASYMPHFSLAAQQAPTGTPITALSWNVRAGGDLGEIESVLGTHPADIVALVEAYPAELIGDPVIAAAYPYHYGPHDSPDTQGLIIFSTYPIADGGMVPTGPAGEGMLIAIWARVDAPEGHQITVVAAHPQHGITCGRKLPLPTCYDTRERDQLLLDINLFVSSRMEQGETILLMGDFNTTEREPAYKDLSTGLLDAYRVAGTGLGNSWSPNDLLKGRLAPLRFPILRIDYQFSSPNLHPTRLSYDCSPHGSDHCIVQGSYTLGD